MELNKFTLYHLNIDIDVGTTGTRTQIISLERTRHIVINNEDQSTANARDRFFLFAVALLFFIFFLLCVC